MTSPAITELLNTHAALIASRELSFDEKVGHLSAILTYSWQPDLTIGQRTALVREALREQVSAQLRASGQKTAALLTDMLDKAERKPPRDLQHEIENERGIIRMIVADGLARPNAVENLQLHTNRLIKLEGKT